MEVKLNETKIMMPNGEIQNILVDRVFWIPVHIPLGDRYPILGCDNRFEYAIVDHTVVIPALITQITLTGDDAKQVLKIKVKESKTQLITLIWDDFECRFDHILRFEFGSWCDKSGSLSEGESLNKHRLRIINTFANIIQWALNHFDIEVDVMDGWQIMGMINRDLRVGCIEEVNNYNRYHRLVTNSPTRTIALNELHNRVHYPKFDEI